MKTPDSRIPTFAENLEDRQQEMRERNLKLREKERYDKAKAKLIKKLGPDVVIDDFDLSGKK